MKRFFFAIAIMATSLLGGCLDSDDDDSDYASVYPGMVIFTQATTTNKYSSDGLSIGMRFAILLAEMEKASLSFTGYVSEPDWDQLGTFEYAYNGVTYNKKEFLFGTSSEVKILQVDTNQYSLTFGGDQGYHVSGIYDDNYRQGTYLITFDIGDNLDVSGNKMTISLPDSYMGFSEANNALRPDITASKSTTYILCDDEGEFSYSVSTTMEIERYDDDDDYLYETCSWGSNGLITIQDYEGLDLDSTITKTYAYDLSASGTSLWDNIITYRTTESLIYKPSVSRTKAITGNETCIIYYANTTLFPESTVIRETYSDGSWIYYYDDYTYSYED